MKYQKLLIAALILFNSHILFAQKWEVGASLGLGHYRGDISGNKWMPINPAFEIFAKKNFNPVWSLKGGYSNIALGASDNNSSDGIETVRGATLNNTISNIFLTTEYNFEDFRNPKKLMKATPYITAGLAGYVYVNHGYFSSLSYGVSVPMGFGAKFMLNKYWNLGAQFVAYKTFTDNIDGIRDVFSTKDTRRKFEGNNPSINDWYMSSTLSLSYVFYSIKCPAFQGE